MPLIFSGCPVSGTPEAKAPTQRGGSREGKNQLSPGLDLLRSSRVLTKYANLELQNKKLDTAVV